jgi:hypothetical protein
MVGNIRQNAEGRWEIEDKDGRPYDKIPGFAGRDDAALFLYMRGREYVATVDVPEHIEIRVAPNFEKWYGPGCTPGLWAASLHFEDGRTAGATRCAPTVAEAKRAGVEQALGRNCQTPGMALFDFERLDWPERESK